MASAPPTAPGRVAIIGAGTIGAAWAARFLLHGVDVTVHDRAPEAPDLVARALGRAREAWAGLGLPTVREGTLRIASTIEEAVRDAEHVQESVPEDPAIKRETHAEIDRVAPAEAVIASSTSGLKPTEMQANLAHPERLVVGHPFVPVYLIPLVEVVGGESTSSEKIEQALATYTSVSMKPLHVRVEIDAFVADRLLEAVWREALWLVNDGVATTEEIDDAIRYGFGLRWAQMGLFETYRLGGGEGGMAHFLGQFGPSLAWPWSHLTDVPDLDDALIARIAEQSDAQSGAYSIEELERSRDENLVAILRALEGRRWGAGELLAHQRNRLERESD